MNTATTEPSSQHDIRLMLGIEQPPQKKYITKGLLYKLIDDIFYRT